MNQSQLDRIESLLGSLEERVGKLEGKKSVARPEPIALADVPVAKKLESSNILGIVGVACFILAMILLISFSIESGWLTPVRQMLLATLFGLGLIATPFVLASDDRSYLSLLPAGGVVVLHLTVYGSVFFHGILTPLHGIWLVGGVGLLSIWLLSKFRFDIYAVLAIAGTYIGAYFLQDSFDSFERIIAHQLLWDVAFCYFAIQLKNRKLIAITGYFALGLITLQVLPKSLSGEEFARSIAIVQFLQVGVLALATALYSVRNRAPLSNDEAWSLLPLFIFFYGQEFFFLNQISQTVAVLFSVGFSLLVLGIYGVARVKLGKDHLASSPAVLTYVAFMFFHSIYVITLDDVGKVIFGFALLLSLGFLAETLKRPPMRVLLILFGSVIGYSMLLIFNNEPALPDVFLMGFAVAYALAFLVGYHKSRADYLLYTGHFMMVTGLTRLGDVIGEVWVAPLCVAYAYVALTVALKRVDKVLAQSAFPLIFFAIGRFMIFNFEHLEAMPRILSLLAMGVIIYLGGYVYRKVPTKS